ncbi:MAG: GatB/YqeY domain-containing protein [Candidatus Saccharibacteria bacterium]
MLKQQIDKDLKAALLGGDKDRVTTLRGLKSVILYAEVAKGVREAGLSDDEILPILAKEAKKRQESADLYVRGNSQERADAELAEKAIIEEYLPKQLDDTELIAAIDEIMAEFPEASPQIMGQVIGKVKQKTEGRADGARIAQLVKERLS